MGDLSTPSTEPSVGKPKTNLQKKLHSSRKHQSKPCDLEPQEQIWAERAARRQTDENYEVSIAGMAWITFVADL